MAMAKFDVDTTNKLFVAKVGVVNVDIKVDLYSDAKEHWLVDAVAGGFDFPIRTAGGDPLGGSQNIAPYFFLRDGWKIRPQESNHTLVFSGNLFLDEGEVGGLVVPTLGGFTVLVNIVTSPQALEIVTASNLAGIR